ncbi:hypothetical protein L1049_016860 [Liquidambar formosana]|uniref:Uncharacterized protein n=1 Tax=Liquidambar formosana TaxID=63359 RepID=A0AAP0S1Z2_LIQFO
MAPTTQGFKTFMYETGTTVSLTVASSYVLYKAVKWARDRRDRLFLEEVKQRHAREMEDEAKMREETDARRRAEVAEREAFFAKLSWIHVLGDDSSLICGV